MAKATDVRGTPLKVFRAIQREFNIEFDLDVCAMANNRMVDNYFGPDQRHASLRDALAEGLIWSHHGTAMWMNPPYSEIPIWLARARLEVATEDEARVVALLPSSTSSRWWHSYIWNRHRAEWRPLVRRVQFWPKRINFAPHFTGAKWPSVVVEFKAVR